MECRPENSMTFAKIARTAIATIIGFTTLSAPIDIAQAGPGLTFLHHDFEMSEADCITTGVDLLLAQGLQLPNTLLRLNQSPVVGGENNDFTAAIDCSMAENTGRIQVIVSHLSSSKQAFELANTLLNQLQAVVETQEFSSPSP